MSLRDLFARTPHPFAVGDRVDCFGKLGTARVADWQTVGKEAHVPYVTVALDDQGDRRPNEPERLYRWKARQVRLVSAVEQLADLTRDETCAER